MPEFVLSFIGTLAALLFWTLLLFIMARPVIKTFAGMMLKRFLKDPYWENVWEMFSVVSRTGLQIIFETGRRAASGRAIDRPFGSVNPFPNFQGLMFNPAQLARLPTPRETKIDTSVVIGPGARKPMKQDIPIMISGMAYGLALSKEAKMALAKGSALAGTSVNTGEGAILPEERQLARHYVVQLGRGLWGRKPEDLKKADMIEIQIGQGATAGVGKKIHLESVEGEMAELLEVDPGAPLLTMARFPGIDQPGGLKNLVDRLRDLSGGVPIGIKMAATQSLELDMALALEAGVDAITLDGAGAATKGTLPILEDDFGLPTVYAVSRAARFLENQGLKGRVTLIVSGGLTTPGSFLKALALGADAVAVGTVALFAMTHTQLIKTVPWEPPTQLVWFWGRIRDQLNVDLGAYHVANFLKSATLEMEEAVRALGKTSIRDVNREDLFALDEVMARATGVSLGRPDLPIPPTPFERYTPQMPEEHDGKVSENGREDARVYPRTYNRPSGGFNNNDPIAPR